MSDLTQAAAAMRSFVEAATRAAFVISEAVEPSMIFLVGPPPRREDFATDVDYYEASARRMIQIAVADIARP